MTDQIEDDDKELTDALREAGYEVIVMGEGAESASDEATTVGDALNALNDLAADNRVMDVKNLMYPPNELSIEQAILDDENERPDEVETDDDDFDEQGNFNIRRTDVIGSIGDGSEGVIEGTEEDEDEDSALSAESLVVTRGAPKEHLMAAVGEVNGLKLFMGSDGRSHKETPRARQAFEDYYRMGRGRSLRKLAELYSKPENTQWTNNFAGVHRKLQDYSSNLDWQNRIRMFVIQESAQAIAAAQKSAATHKRARISRAVKMQRIGERILDKARILDVEGFASDLTTEEARELIKPAVTMLQIGMQLERAEIGESIEKIKPPKDIAEMTDEELEEFIGVLQTELG